MVGDCSVVSSLGVCAHFELKHKHNRRLVTSNIFPQVHNLYIYIYIYIYRMNTGTQSTTQQGNTWCVCF